MAPDVFIAQQRVDAFRVGLGNVGARIDQSAELDALLDLADRNGWTAEQIGQWIAARLPAAMSSPGGLVLIKLRDAARMVRPVAPHPHAVEASTNARTKPGTFRQPKAPCGSCDGGPGRWLTITPEGHRGQAQVRHCPFCWVAPPNWTPPRSRST